MVKAYFKGLELEVSEGVYVPREDTELLVDILDVIEQGSMPSNVDSKITEPSSVTSNARRSKIKGSDEVLEIGAGSGAVSVLVAKKACRVVGVDIDPQAVVCATKNAEMNGVTNVSFLESDMFSRVRGVFDIVIFNAPYLPVGDPWELRLGAKTWAGGATGRDIVQRFADGLGEHLKKGGRAFVVISSFTGLDETVDLFSKKGFNVEIAGQKKVPWEMLYCLRVSR